MMNKNQHTFEAKNIVTGYDKKIIIYNDFSLI